MHEATADEIVETNEQSRIDGLRVAMALLAMLSLIALPFTRGIPRCSPGEKSAADPAPA